MNQENIDHSNNQIYLADEINPAAYPIEIKADFTKVLFHFRKNENGTSYFVTLKHDDERILLPFFAGENFTFWTASFAESFSEGIPFKISISVIM